MTHFIDRASLTLLWALVASASRSIVIAGLATAGIAIFRVKATSLRLFIWTSVLYGSLAMPLLGWILIPVQVRVPEFLQQGVAQTRHEAGSATLLATVGGPRPVSRREIKIAARETRALVPSAAEDRRRAPAGVGASESRFWPAFQWNEIAAVIYVVATLLFLVRFLAGIVVSGRLVRKALLIRNPSLAQRLECDEVSARVRIATSEWISVPLTVGILQPTILLPADWEEWDDATLRAVLAHERSHVARRDPLTQCVSLLYRAFFWFSPLSWWLHQHLNTLGEQASDEAALSGGADQKQYARTLLGFLEALQTAPGRIRWQGVSMARPGEAEQRLERILAWKGSVAMKLKRSLAVAILVFAIPVVYLAASVRPASPSPSASPVVAQQPAAPAAPSAPPVGGISAVAPIAGAPSVAPVPPAAPTAPTAALTPEAAWEGFGQGHSHGTGHGKGFSYHYGYDDEERFVIVSGKSDSFTMSGSTQDIHHVENLKKQIQGDFIWFQRDEKSYIIRDQATIDRARAFWAPQEELGKKQEELGKQQEALGKQQEELGNKMEQVRVNVPDMTAALDRLKAKLQKLGPSATMEQIGELQSEIGELQSKIGEIQSQAGESQSKLGAQQGELGEKQGKLGELQGELGRQQGELAEKAAKEMKQLLDDAIKNGTAKPETEFVKDATL